MKPMLLVSVTGLHLAILGCATHRQAHDPEAYMKAWGTMTPEQARAYEETQRKIQLDAELRALEVDELLEVAERASAVAERLPASDPRRQQLVDLAQAAIDMAETKLRQQGALIQPERRSPAPQPAQPRWPDVGGGAPTLPSFEIELSHDDELFIINGEKFSAITYCFDMEQGDRVVFIDGNPYGACVRATVINLRTRQKCDLWCE